MCHRVQHRVCIIVYRIVDLSSCPASCMYHLVESAQLGVSAEPQDISCPQETRHSVKTQLRRTIITSSSSSSFFSSSS
ncbi:hypothetical protein E2C01_089153 [Portunus trituberculatus]|uniref:Uncharacterized protein n=1 Tax=Portunus trituberculatus TaxID=210409 RepID=A0A5B7JI02_PORTR|nr:hypothetical protein [Portunus trituberculatus]